MTLLETTQLAKGLFSKEGKPRLFFARTHFFEYGTDPNLSLEELKEFYKQWRDFEEWLILQKQEHHYEKGKFLGINKSTVAVKTSKRGNDVYFWRIKQRLHDFKTIERDFTLFDPRSNIKKTPMVLTTLTYDTKIDPIRYAWEDFGIQFNRWITRLRKQYGRISYIRVWESTKAGYPHCHVLLFFHDYEFRVFRSYSKQHHKWIWRVGEKQEFERSWHSWVDVEGVRSVRRATRYIIKYLSKWFYESEGETREPKAKLLSLAMCWIFKKRSYAVSGDFSDLINGLPNSNRFLFQMDLFGEVVPPPQINWVFIGLMSTGKLKQEFPDLDYESFSLILPRCP